MDEKDLVLIVSKSGESEFIRNITFNLNNRGVTIISLTNYGNNTLARRSDYNLFVDVEKVDLVDNVNFESMTLFFLNSGNSVCKVYRVSGIPVRRKL